MDDETILRPEDDYAGFLAMMGSNDETPPADAIESDPNEIPVDPDEVDEENDELPPDDDEVPEEEEELPPEENDEEVDDEEIDDSPLEVDLDTVITLPDGTERTIEELTQGYADNTAVSEREAKLKTLEDEYNAKHADLNAKLKLAKLEADDVLEKFEGFDWNSLLQENAEEFGKTKMFVERYQNRAREIQNAMNELNAKEQKRVEADNHDRAVKCVRDLQKGISGWNNNLYHQILEYAVGAGVDEKYITTCTDASVIKAFYDSMRLAKGENVVKAKVKKAVQSPKRVLSAQAKKSVANKKPVNTSGLQGKELDEFAAFQKFI